MEPYQRKGQITEIFTNRGTVGGDERDAHSQIYGVDTRTQVYPVTRVPSYERRGTGGGEQKVYVDLYAPYTVPESQRKGYKSGVTDRERMGIGGEAKGETSAPYGSDERTQTYPVTQVPPNERQVIGGGARIKGN